MKEAYLDAMSQSHCGFVQALLEDPPPKKKKKKK